LFIVNTYSLSYNWPNNPTHVSIMKPHIVALFGPQSYAGFTKIAKVAVPALFCDSVTDFDATNTILLVERGNCSFYQKAQNAMRSGASAVIIADTNAEGLFDSPLRMGYPVTENPSSIMIPTVSTSGFDFITIQKLIFSSNSTLWIYLEQSGFSDTTGSPLPREDHSGRGHDSGRRSYMTNGMFIAAIVVSSCFCGVCVGRRCGKRRFACRRQQAAPNAPIAMAMSSHGGQRYDQVDESALPVAYYGEQEVIPAAHHHVDVVLPSAPPHDSSYPSSAPSNYA